MSVLQFHKGLKADLPTSGLVEGSYYQCTDTGELFLATSATSMLLVAIGEAPKDSKPYGRKNKQWVEVETPQPPTPKPPLVYEITSSQVIDVPEGYNHCDAFLVNGGNGGRGGLTSNRRKGLGGNTKQVSFDISGTTLNVTIGAGGTGSTSTSGSGEKGGTTSIVDGSTTYSPTAQAANSGDGAGTDGVLNPLNESDTNLYGASGSTTTTQGKTGGGYASSGKYNATFYGAGGGVYNNSPGKGYQGYAYIILSAE